ncbi:XRE family transcriptional regulator, partial [Bacillus sp. SIMBA_031]
MTEIEAGSGNVYADLNGADANEMLVKAQLASKICSIIKARHLTQLEAAAVL